MKIRRNKHDGSLLHIEPETRDERKTLEDMWRNGIEAFSFGSGPHSELGICSKRVFGSGFKLKGEKNE